MSGSRRRRRSRRRATPAQQQGAPPPRRRGGLRATIDSFGGFLTLGAIAAALVVVVVLVLLNRPDSSGSVGGGEFVLRERAAPASGRLLGDPDAPVRLIAYEDFSCGHCGDFALDTEPLIEQEFVETGMVVIEYRDMAILGADSERAAAAASCAADQDLFWEYHDILFLRQGTAGWASSGNLKDFAREVDDALGGGFDLEAFDACVDSGEHEGAVAASTSEATELFAGLTGSRASTPSFLIDGRPLVGAQGIEVFREAIRAGLPATDGGGG